MSEPSKIITRRPAMKETVGAHYFCFNNPEDGTDYDPTKYESTVSRTDTVKKVSVTENVEGAVVRASGKDYKTTSQTSSIDIAVEVVAVVPEELKRMRGEKTTSHGLNQSGAKNRKPFFAYGKVVEKTDKFVKYEWFPKCQLVENTDDIETSEESFKEQNDTLTIRAYAFDDDGNIRNYIDQEEESCPKGVTEEAFFSAPIITDEDLAKIIPEQV